MDTQRVEQLKYLASTQPYPLLFAIVSGAHLYGFPSPNSDYDLRGVHVLPSRDVLGLGPNRETILTEDMLDGMELDLVTHDISKFFRMLLKPNGYVLEQLYSPLVIHSTPEHLELKEIARDCITRQHSRHYLGFSATQWKLFNSEELHRIKPLLYLYRVLLTGIHLMSSGEIQANLLILNEEFKLPYIADLVAQKVEGAEKSTLKDANLPFHEEEYKRLRAELEAASLASKLPQVPTPTCRAALNDLLVRVRLKETMQPALHAQN